MDNDFELDLGERRISWKAPSAVNIMLCSVVLIAAIVSMGELTFTVKGVINVTLTILVLYIVASIVYPNSYISGMAKEKLSTEYKEVKQAYDDAVKEVHNRKMLPELSRYCLKYSREELRACRSAILLDECIEYDVFEEDFLGKTAEDLKGGELSAAAVKCILDANKVKALKITPSQLMSTGEDVTLFQRIFRVLGFRRKLGVESKTKQQIDYGVNLIVRAVTTLLAGVVGISVVMDDFSFKTLAEWAMKMLPIAIAALGGNIGGHRNVTDTLIPQLQRKTKIIQTQK